MLVDLLNNKRVNMKNITELLILVSLSSLFSCEVSEGEGGSGKISGLITEERYNDDYSLLISSAPAMDKNVYILFGDDKTVGEQVETSAEGYFEFPYLYEGNYTIYYYSDDKENPGEEIAISVSVDLANGESEDLGELITYEHLEFDDGKASIYGKVYEIQYSKNSYYPNLVPEDTLILTEKEVYLTYGNHLFYDECVRTQEDGSFYFQDLIPGDYKIVVYGEDVMGTDQQTATTRYITIEENTDEIHAVDDIYVANM